MSIPYDDRIIVIHSDHFFYLFVAVTMSMMKKRMRKKMKKTVNWMCQFVTFSSCFVEFPFFFIIFIVYHIIIIRIMKIIITFLRIRSLRFIDDIGIHIISK